MTTQMEVKRRSADVSGVSNVAFDLLTILENKLQGISAMEEYRMDCQDAGDTAAQDLLEELERREVEDVNRLKGYLKDRL